MTRVTARRGEGSAESNSGTMTQPVTAADLRAGRIRIPRSSKGLFPPERTYVMVRLRGAEMQSRYDPRRGPPERPGVLGIGKAVLNELVNEGERLRVFRSGGRVVLE